MGEYVRTKTPVVKVIYTPQKYTKGCMHKLNRHLVVLSCMRIRSLVKRSSGTANKVNYAREEELETVNMISN